MSKAGTYIMYFAQPRCLLPFIAYTNVESYIPNLLCCIKYNSFGNTDFIRANLLDNGIRIL